VNSKRKEIERRNMNISLTRSQEIWETNIKKKHRKKWLQEHKQNKQRRKQNM
jgi:hypothetical protein